MQGRKSNSSRRVKLVVGVAVLGVLVLALCKLLWLLPSGDSGRLAKAANTFLKYSPNLHEKEKGDNDQYFEFISDKSPSGVKRFMFQATKKPFFDYNKCVNGFKVYVYSVKEGSRLSPVYSKLIKALLHSPYYTPNPQIACLFVLSLDTIDRDPRSTDYVRNLELKIQKLHLWNNGVNHLIFNFFTGGWPNYSEDLSFDFGNAIIARSSFSELMFRRDVDISFPLFSRTHPFSDEAKIADDVRMFPVRRKILIGFKGKRYVHGIGSETRNALHVLHNGKDIVLLTTCKHGKDWAKFKDDRCDADNIAYDNYSYRDILVNTTFCLIPRGRRLGSFRMLESLESGCIPVILSNGLRPPFADVIDWKKAAIFVDERFIYHVPTILRTFTDEQILRMRQQVFFLWQTYFSSVKRIVHTCLEILKDRIFPSLGHSSLMWNSPPGALFVHTEFSQSAYMFPFYHGESSQREKFTAIILATSPVRYASCPLFRLIQSINQSHFVDQILVIWLPAVKIPDKELWPRTKVTLRVAYPGKMSLNSRFMDTNLITTDAVFSFDEDVVISQDEMDFAFKTWKSFPERIVGFTSRTHFWDYASQQWEFSSMKGNQFSFVMPNAAIYHRYYNYVYTKHLPTEMEEMVNQFVNCEGIALNFVISSLTKKSPILLCSSHHFYGGLMNKEKLGVKVSQDEFFKQEKLCFKEFSRVMTSTVLSRSFVKIEPLLFKDPVSNFRKRYRLFEM